jgi:formate C-acetyltransferase
MTKTYSGWTGFEQGNWTECIDVRDFIQKNYTPYLGGEEFLSSATPKTQTLWNQTEELIKEELHKGVMDVETSVFSGVDSFKAGYINKESEVILGLQTDKPLKRIVNPYGGFRMAEAALDAYGYKLQEGLKEHFTTYRKTHNEGVFDAYTDEMKRARSSGLLTGLPDAYGRGRIIGDYRRIALYGVDHLIEDKKEDLKKLSRHSDLSLEESIRLREEVAEQIRALEALKAMANRYEIDLSNPATNAYEAVQFFYLGYLAAIKENNGAAMSLGRNTTFLDVFIERDLRLGHITEEEAQELIDQLVIKLRIVRHLRTPDYNTLFAGDPTWVTEAIGGMGEDGRTLVTKTAFRFLHTLTNLGPAPEPNMTVLWSEALPTAFKRYCMAMTTKTGAIQYENDDLMRPLYTDDYGISCCVSAMTIGKQMQYFGARTNLAKALLYTINGGYDELKSKADGTAYKVLDDLEPISTDVLEYDEVLSRFKRAMDEVARIYVDTMNVIHYMHDKYAYEAVQMGLHDTKVERLMAYGIAGISVVADSLSAIKHAKVKPIRDVRGIVVDYSIEGDYPKYGNDDDRVDLIAVDVATYFMSALRRFQPYRKATQTLSLLTITSNVVYGKKTGATPDGRLCGEPFAPGANPMHGRDEMGALASLNTVAKLPYKDVCQDGISNTFSIVPEALGTTEEVRYQNLAGILDGYFSQGAFHLNVNVLSKALLLDAMAHPEKYPTLTIRVSGYAVHFNRLTKEQKLEVINRTFHNRF